MSAMLMQYPENLNCGADLALPEQEQLARAVCHAAAEELQDASRLIRHCLEQLSEEQVWHRQDAALNAIGNLVLHLAGNLRQWVIAGLGNWPDMRHRPSEFSQREAVAKERLLIELEACGREAVEVLNQLDARQLLASRRIQGFEMSGAAALGHAIPHFRGHTQEIVGRTRQYLGPAYRFAWTPQTAEQGAAGSVE